MKSTFPLGRWGGVVVGAHWSVVVMIVLIADVVAGIALPATAPGFSASMYWTVGGVSAALFVLSLLMHELSHAIVARREGVRVKRITLWMLGGATELDGEAESPGAELRIAVAGPLTSLLTAGIFAVITAVSTAFLAPRPVVAALTWLSLTNAILAVFNALPGAPLDGGRVAHALLWRRSGDRDLAGVTAARIGQVLGGVILIAGLAELLLLNNLIGGVWLAMIGWFMIRSAAAEGLRRQAHAQLGGVLVRHAMDTEPSCAPSWWTVDAFLTGRAHHQRARVFAVLDFTGAPAGVVSLTELARVPDAAQRSTRIADVCRPLSAVPIARPDDMLTDMRLRAGLRQGEDLIVVLDRDFRLAGVLGPEDVKRAAQLCALGVDLRVAGNSLAPAGYSPDGGRELGASI